MPPLNVSCTQLWMYQTLIWGLAGNWLTFLCFSRRLGEFIKFTSDCHVLAEFSHPTHLIRNCHFPHWARCPQMASTSYFSSPSTNSGDVKFRPCSLVSLYGVNSNAWNIGCIFYALGSWSLYVSSPRTSAILSSPTHFGENFLGVFRWRLVAFNQTCVPFLNSFHAVQVLCATQSPHMWLV